MSDDDSVEVLPIGEDGEPVKQDEDQAKAITDLVEQPAKVMRIGTMIKQLLDEVKEAPLDDASRSKLAEIHQKSVAELKDGLAPELVEELERLSLPLEAGAETSDAEIRIAQAQLVGWLEGLFHGIQTALFAQQVSAKAAFEEMRRRAITGAPSNGQGAEQPQQPSGPYL
ncbi:MAG: bacterial proteasome activator family protein [Actinomycetia bacterium]|nr:bacterial proteasome activator family protein [Actinomycetes bacterium]